MSRKFDNLSSSSNDEYHVTHSPNAKGCLSEFLLFIIFASVILGIILALAWCAIYLYTSFMSAIYM